VEVIGRYWHAFAGAVGDFLDEAAFRVVLAFDVLAGRMPQEVERRWWNRAVETPALVDVHDWTNDRLIFSVLVWPSLESGAYDADYAHHQRIDEVKKAIAKGASEMAWSTRFETDYGLKWDADRRVWTTRGGFAYETPAEHDAA
jgi:hypothetical protein